MEQLESSSPGERCSSPGFVLLLLLEFLELVVTERDQTSGMAFLVESTRASSSDGIEWFGRTEVLEAKSSNRLRGEDPVEDGCLNNASLSEGGPLGKGKGGMKASLKEGVHFASSGIGEVALAVE
jgi:hypothetical protein